VAYFTAATFGPIWRRQLLEQIEELQQKLVADIAQRDEIPLNPDQFLLEAHSQNMKSFFNGIGGATDDYVSHTTCFCCLLQMPEHPLPCGHVLCTHCIKAYGRTQNRAVYELRCCPIHPDYKAWGDPIKVRLKPEFAGTRILTLDGYVII